MWSRFVFPQTNLWSIFLSEMLSKMATKLWTDVHVLCSKLLISHHLCLHRMKSPAKTQRWNSRQFYNTGCRYFHQNAVLRIKISVSIMIVHSSLLVFTVEVFLVALFYQKPKSSPSKYISTICFPVAKWLDLFVGDVMFVDPSVSCNRYNSLEWWPTCTVCKLFAP